MHSWIVQSFGAKTATAANVKNTTPVAYPMHGTLMNFTYSFLRWLTVNGRSIARYVGMKSIVPKENAGALNEAEASLQNRFTGNKNIYLVDNIVVWGKDESRYLYMIMLHFSLEKLLEALKGVYGEGS